MGDAARVTEPVTGEGVYFALKRGELAAKSIEMAFDKGNFSARELSSYETLCQKGFSFRKGINTLIRLLIRHPSALEPRIELSTSMSVPLFRLLVDIIVREN